MSEGRRAFHQQLQRLEADGLGTLDLVLAQLDRTLEALETQDIELGQIVVDRAHELHVTCADVHAGLLALLALQAPVAGELRIVAAVLHLLKHAQRMGAQCVSIARLLPLAGHDPPVRRQILRRTLAMGRHARAEVLQARRAFAERDVAMAQDLLERDREVNRLNREIFRLAIDAGDDADTREWAMIMALAARALERVGDNAVDVGEQATFVATGRLRAFPDMAAAVRAAT
jgi:phosphate transport system protein